MKVRVTVFILACLLFFHTLAFAQDFTAKTLSDHGNVTVMEVSGNYDANNPDGTINAGPRESIAKEFFRLHKDEYDFLVIFSNFNFQMPAAEAKAFYLHIKNDTQGIGRPLIAAEGEFQVSERFIRDHNRLAKVNTLHGVFLGYLLLPVQAVVFTEVLQKG